MGQSAGGLSAADYSRRLFCGAAKRRDHRAPIQKRSFIDQAEKAIYSLCYLRREYSITLNYKGGPLDYFQLPVTPFLLSLRKRPLLQHWVTDRGVFHQRYLSEVLRKHQERN